MFPGHRGRMGREVFEGIGTGGRIGHQCFLQRFAGVVGFQHAQLTIAVTHDFRRPAQDAGPIRAAGLGPNPLRRLCRLQRLINDLRRGSMERAEHLSRGRIDHRNRVTSAVLNIGSIDKMAGFGGRECHYNPHSARRSRASHSGSVRCKKRPNRHALASLVRGLRAAIRPARARSAPARS